MPMMRDHRGRRRQGPNSESLGMFREGFMKEGIIELNYNVESDLKDKSPPKYIVWIIGIFKWKRPTSRVFSHPSRKLRALSGT